MRILSLFVLSLFIPALAFAQAAPAEAAPSPFVSLMPLLLIFVVFYFLMIRPQQKRHKEHQLMLGALKKGDQVITGGGIFGKVMRIEDDKVAVEIASGVEITVVKTLLQQVMVKPEAGKPAHQEKSKSERNDNVLPAKERIANDN